MEYFRLQDYLLYDGPAAVRSAQDPSDRLKVMKIGDTSHFMSDISRFGRWTR